MHRTFSIYDRLDIITAFSEVGQPLMGCRNHKGDSHVSERCDGHE